LQRPEAAEAERDEAQVNEDSYRVDLEASERRMGELETAIDDLHEAARDTADQHNTEVEGLQNQINALWTQMAGQARNQGPVTTDNQDRAEVDRLRTELAKAQAMNAQGMDLFRRFETTHGALTRANNELAEVRNTIAQLTTAQAASNTAITDLQNQQRLPLERE
jgi:chromosome segregation ATPase